MIHIASHGLGQIMTQAMAEGKTGIIVLFLRHGLKIIPFTSHLPEQARIFVGRVSMNIPLVSGQWQRTAFGKLPGIKEHNLL